VSLCRTALRVYRLINISLTDFHARETARRGMRERYALPGNDARDLTVARAAQPGFARNDFRRRLLDHQKPARQLAEIQLSSYLAAREEREEALSRLSLARTLPRQKIA